MTCGTQNLPLRGDNETRPILDNGSLSNENDGVFRALLRLQTETDENLRLHFETTTERKKYTSPLIQNEIIDVIGGLIQKRIVNEITDNSDCFSILADETQDITTIEQLSLCLRYTVGGSVVENFVGFKDLYEDFELDFDALNSDEVPEPKLTGKKIGSAIVEMVESLGLDINKCCGQGYDGARVMSSELAGASGYILEKNPRALYTHCVAHCLNLAVIDSCKQQDIRNMMGTIREVSSFFNASAKRNKILKGAIAHIFTEEGVQRSLTRLCETRWVERHECLQTFLRLLSAIRLALDMVGFACFFFIC